MSDVEAQVEAELALATLCASWLHGCNTGNGTWGDVNVRYALRDNHRGVFGVRVTLFIAGQVKSSDHLSATTEDDRVTIDERALERAVLDWAVREFVNKRGLR